MNEPDIQKQLAVFDALLDDLSRSAADPTTASPVFFRALLDLIDTIIVPTGTAVIASGPQQTYLLIAGSERAADEVRNWIELPGPTNDENNISLKPTHATVNVVPILISSSTWGWLVSQSATTHPPVHRQLLTAVAQIIGEFLTTQVNQKATLFQQRLQQFTHHVHASLDPEWVAQHIVNDGRLLMGCERVSLYAKRGSRTKLLAVSGIARLEQRSDLLRQQLQLIKLAIATNEPIGSDQPPPSNKLNDRLKSYQQRSGFPFLLGIPLHSGKQSIGFLLTESTEDIERTEFARGVSVVIPAATSSLNNALQYDSIPWRGLFNWVPNSLRQLARATIIIGAIALLIGSLFFVKTEFKIRIQGELLPVEQRSLFAPQDGIVEQVLTRNGAAVEIGQRLIEIRSPELELALAKNKGETEKQKTLLDVKKIALNQAASDNNAAPAVIGQITSDISDVEYQIRSLADEESFLRQQQSELALTSPISGTVITWNVDELLLKKPVRWGESLVQIANEEGAWELRFLVPERRLGYLLSAREHGSGEQMEFFFEANPTTKFESSITEIGNSTQQDVVLGSVAVLVAPATEGAYVRRHGARVIADISCGTKSIAYVWTHEWIDSIRRRFVW